MIIEILARRRLHSLPLIRIQFFRYVATLDVLHMATSMADFVLGTLETIWHMIAEFSIASSEVAALASMSEQRVMFINFYLVNQILKLCIRNITIQLIHHTPVLDIR